MRISDWSSDVCSSDLLSHPPCARHYAHDRVALQWLVRLALPDIGIMGATVDAIDDQIMTVMQLVGETAQYETDNDRRGRAVRSEARRVGEEWVRTCRSRG